MPHGTANGKTYESGNITKTGFKQALSHYQANNCKGCPLRGRCHQSKANRSIERNHNLEHHKEIIRHLLQSEEGIAKRFMLKSLPKVEIEFGLHALAHHMRKRVA